jgi:hypothetical protein
VAVINLVEATHDGSPTYCQTLGTQLARLQPSIRLQHPGRVTNAKSNVGIGNHDVNGPERQLNGTNRLHAKPAPLCRDGERILALLASAQEGSACQSGSFRVQS